MSKAFEQLKNYLACIRKGRVEAPENVLALLSACWNELNGDTRGILPLQVPAFAKDMEWNPPRLTFQMNWQVGRSKYADTFTVDVDTGSLTNATDVLFDEILKSPPAKKLIAAKLHPVTLLSWLRAIAEAPSKRHENCQLTRKRAKSLAKRCRKLATAIEDAGAPFWMLGTEIIELRELPKSLAHFADAWELGHKRRLSARISDPRAGVILNFIRVIKDTTGSEHYEQVADLLNAIDVIPRYRHPRKALRDASNLKQLAYREREKAKDLLAAFEREDLPRLRTKSKE